MTYIEQHGFGDPEVLQPGKAALPVPGNEELLIKVAAAGVNGPDLLQRKGKYSPPVGASPILGLELSGTVAAVGPGTKRFKVGDKVCALAPGGAYAEYAVVPEPHALRIPEGLSMIEAAGLPETYFTVWTNLFERGSLAPGETVLIHGGTGGIGTTAIQLAVAFGATVFTTVPGTAKVHAIERLGATRAIDYLTEDFVEVVKAATGGRGVDVILDVVGGSYVARNIEVAALDGRIVQISWLTGSEISTDFWPLMLKRLTWTGSTLRARTVEQKAAIARSLEANVWPLIASGKVKPLVHATFPLAEAARAHALMEKQEHIGKIVLVAE
ncbi:NAD(P)H-quinone oxidoreductase [Noviherbaspirillum saxi]